MCERCGADVFACPESSLRKSIYRARAFTTDIAGSIVAVAEDRPGEACFRSACEESDVRGRVCSRPESSFLKSRYLGRAFTTCIAVSRVAVAEATLVDEARFRSARSSDVRGRCGTELCLQAIAFPAACRLEPPSFLNSRYFGLASIALSVLVTYRGGESEVRGRRGDVKVQSHMLSGPSVQTGRGRRRGPYLRPRTLREK